MLGEPALVAGHHARDAQREALLREQRVAAVARAVRPDLAGVGELHDVLRVVAGPVDLGAAVADAVDERVAHRVDRAHPGLAGLDEAVDRLPHAGHDAHGEHDVGRVGDLDAELRDRAAERAHRERHDVHRAALHRAVEDVEELGAHLARVAPVVRRAGVLLVGRADERAVLDAGDVARRRCGRGSCSGRHSGLSFTSLPSATSCLVRRSASCLDPSHQTISSGLVSAAISSTQARRAGSVVPRCACSGSHRSLRFRSRTRRSSSSSLSWVPDRRPERFVLQGCARLRHPFGQSGR